MMRAVRFHEYGGLENLRVEEVPLRDPADDEVVVSVRFAGVNPGEIGILSGAMDGDHPKLPSGEGTEFSGVVTVVGAAVTEVAVGDDVIGFSDERDAQAESVVLPTTNVLPKPAGVAWDAAAAIPIAGATAMAMVGAVDPQPGETVVVAGAAGGVGYVLAQLLVRAGVTVIGTAAEVDHDALRAKGVTPVLYGDGVEQRIRSAAPNGVDAFLDTHGDGQADVAVALGVPRERIDSIIDFGAGQRLGIRNVGMYQLPDLRRTVIEVADLVAAGELDVPVKAVFGLDRIADAYRAIGGAPGVGKVVVEPGR